MKNMNIDIDIYEDSVFISEPDSSGCTYRITCKEDLKDAICKYIDLYVEE